MEFKEVSYRVGGHLILNRLNLQIQRGETLVLLGRSGSGKTTALRLINRMVQLSAGDICLEGRNLKELDPIALRRRIGYVIQEFGLLPHWTVEQNVALVPKLLGWPVPKQQERVRELLDQVGLPYEDVRNRRPHELSGGQRQRVAVARALAVSPGLLLFDEPFGALDPVTRHEMQQQFLRLRDRYDVAAVFVTHDILEALAVGTKIAVLHEGTLEVVTTPGEFHQARTPTARAFLETLPRAMAPGSSA
ncbi:MAG: ATP-binding cassette domain-containing protein [Acidobacteriaceae bacterium]|nr:ATP-binding cassette domain-containing protein [Acidobacteriaceae bacterium]